MTKDDRISIKQYEQAADEKVSLEGIKWLRKWDVCVQCDSAEEAEALRARLSQPEPAECDGGQCGIGGYCKECPKTQSEPEPEPTAYLCENAVGHKYFRWKKPSSEYKPIALYTAHATPQRIWQGLTNEEVVARANAEVFAEAFARGVAWAELKLKEKNSD